MLGNLFKATEEFKIEIADEAIRSVALHCATEYATHSMMMTDPMGCVKNFEHYIRTGETDGIEDDNS